MKLWIILLIIASFVFWFILGRVWMVSDDQNSFTNRDQFFVFPTPKINTTDPFKTDSRPTLVVTQADSSTSSGVIRF